MKAGCALSRHLDPARALVLATQDAMLHAGREGPPDLLWCVTVGHPPRELDVALAAAQARSKAREAVLVTAAAVLSSTPAEEVDGEPAVGVLVLYGDDALTAWSGKTPRPAWQQQPLVLLTDPETSISVPVRALQDTWDPLRVAGGGAASRDGEAGLFHHGFGNVGHVAISMHSAASEVAVAQGCALLGQVMEVTRADANLLLKLDGQRALDVVLDQLGPRERAQPARALSRTMVAITPPGASRDDLAHGRFAVRPLVGVAPDVGGLAVGENIQEGSRICLCRRDPEHAERALRGALTELRLRLAGVAPVAALYFTCAGRGRGLYGRSNVESELIARALGRVPVLGMAGSYEFGPLGPAGPHVHTYSGVLMVLAEGN